MVLSKNLLPRPVADSISELVEFVLPNDVGPVGNLLGGRLMHWIDAAGALAAIRHSRNYVVTASAGRIDFLAPGRVGDLVILRSSVNRVFHSSMEIGVKVWVESRFTNERRHVSSAYFTFVAVDEHGEKRTVAPVFPQTTDEVRRFEDAMRRRELRRSEAEHKTRRG